MPTNRSDLLPNVSDLLVRPVRIPVEDDIEYGLRLAWTNGLAQVGWLAQPNARRVKLRLCPLCLEEKQTWSKEWRQAPVPVCQSHWVWLVERCSECGASLVWPRLCLLQCHCGADLTNTPALNVSSVLRSYLESRTDAPLEVLLWLGAWIAHGATNKPLKKASCTGVAERVVLLERGADTIKRWPDTFEHALHAHRRPSPPGSVQRLAEAWPGLAIQVSRLQDVGWRERVWTVVNHVVAASHQSPRPIVGRNPKLTQRPKTQKAVADALGIGIARLQTVITQVAPTTPARRSGGGRVRRVISPNVEATLGQSLNTWITVRECARLLGCGRGRVSALAEAGLLGAQAGRLKQETALHLRDRILGRVQVPVSGVLTQALEDVWRFHVPKAASGDFLTAVEDRSIRVYGPPNSQDWRGIRVHTDDLVAWIDAQRPREDHTLSLNEAARALNVKAQVAYELANRGLLRTITLRGAGRHVLPEAVAEFAKRYVVLSELTRLHGVHSHSALAWARAQGYEVVTGPRIDGGRQYFVKRNHQK